MKQKIEGGKKDCLFQYGVDKGCFTDGYSFSLGTDIPEDTELITRDEADRLWEKYYPDFVKQLEKGNRPQMVIWIDCETNVAYHTVGKELDWRDDLEVKDGKVYKITKQPL